MGRLKQYLTFAIVLIPISYSSHSAGEEALPQYQKNMIRQDIQREILNRPASIRGMTTEELIIHEWFSPKVTVDGPRYAPEPIVPELQAFQGIDLPFERVISLVSKTLGYESPIYLRVSSSVLGRAISLNDRFNDLDDLVAYLEHQTSTRIAVYPEARSIIVTQAE